MASSSAEAVASPPAARSASAGRRASRSVVSVIVGMVIPSSPDPDRRQPLQPDVRTGATHGTRERHAAGAPDGREHLPGDELGIPPVPQPLLAALAGHELGLPGPAAAPA